MDNDPANYIIAAHLSKSTPPPVFSNRKEDWPQFVRKFDQWSKGMNGGRPLSDPQQLQMFVSVLPEGLQKEMQLWEREKGRSPTFVELFAYLEAKFGRAHSESMRKRWMEVQLPKNLGKCTLQAFDEFRVNFKLACADVPDATREEARRILLEKLAPFMRKWVVEAESKKMRDHPLLEVSIPTCPNPESCRASVDRWSGAAPTKVEAKGGGSSWLGCPMTGMQKNCWNSMDIR